MVGRPEDGERRGRLWMLGGSADRSDWPVVCSRPKRIERMARSLRGPNPSQSFSAPLSSWERSHESAPRTYSAGMAASTNRGLQRGVRSHLRTTQDGRNTRIRPLGGPSSPPSAATGRATTSSLWRCATTRPSRARPNPRGHAPPEGVVPRRCSPVVASKANWAMLS